MKTRLFLGSLICAATLAGAADAAELAKVIAMYFSDTTFIEVVNESPLDFSSTLLESVGGAFPGESFEVGPMTPAGTADDNAGMVFFAPGGAFSADYEASSLEETSYRVKLTSGSHTFFSNPFSPSNNSSGGYVDFLGLGLRSDFDFVEVATVTSVPEPAVWTSLILGFGLAGALLRRRRALLAAA